MQKNTFHEYFDIDYICYHYQKSDWKLHRLECGVLSKVDKDRLKSLTPSIRLMVKLYLRRKLQNEKVKITYSESVGNTESFF